MFSSAEDLKAGQSSKASLARTGFVTARRLSAAVGIALLLGLGIIREGSLADRVAQTALVALGLASACGWLELVLRGREHAPVRGYRVDRSRRTWLLITLATIAGVGALVQTWIRPGATIAGGDVVVPNGTAWIGRLLESWTWSGSALGEPSQLLLALPWATVLGLIHALGGDAGLAQRVWYTVLFEGAALSALALLAALRMNPIAALAGAAVYVLNPYVMTWVSTYDNYLVTLLLVVAIPATLVAAGNARLSLRWAAVLIAATGLIDRLRLPDSTLGRHGSRSHACNSACSSLG